MWSWLLFLSALLITDGTLRREKDHGDTTYKLVSVNLHGCRGTVVADGFAVYEVLARDGPAFTLAHCWSHAKRKYEEIAEH